MNTIKSIRTHLGMSQRAMAEGIGCTQPNIGFYERGQSIPPRVAAKLIELAVANGVDLTYDHIYGLRELPWAVESSPA
jgi:putative transcriptional regulator